MRALIVAVFITVPLIITPGFLVYFDITPKLVVLYLGVSVLLLFHYGNVANVRALCATRTGRLFGWLMLAAWVSAALSAALSPDRALAVLGSNWRRLGLASYTAILLFAFLIAAWIAAEKRNLIVVLRSVSIAGVLAGSYGVAQYFRVDPLLPVSSYLAGQGPFTIVRPPGTLGHADYFAGWLAMVVFASIALGRVDGSAWGRRLSFAAAAIGTVAIALSGTRAAILGVAAGFAYLLLRIRPKPSPRTIAGCVAAAGLFIGFVASPAGTFLRARIRWSMQDLRGGARLLLWRDSVKLGLERPLFGSGPDTFVAEFPRMQSLELARAYPDFFHESPHSALLDAFTAQGALGVALFGTLLAFGMWAAQRNLSPAAAPLGAALLAALIAHQFMVFVGATALYFSALVAMLAASMSNTGGTDRPPGGEAKQSAVRILIPAEIALAAALAFIAVRTLVSDHAVVSAMRSANAGDIAAAAREYSMACAWQLPGHGADLAYSRSMASLAARLAPGEARAAAWRQAVESGRRAVNTSDDAQNAWYHLAILFSAQEDALGVERCLRAASSVAPAWFKPHWALARLLELSGRRREALDEAVAAVARNGGKDQDVLDTWRHIRAQKP